MVFVFKWKFVVSGQVIGMIV